MTLLEQIEKVENNPELTGLPKWMIKEYKGNEIDLANDIYAGFMLGIFPINWQKRLETLEKEDKEAYLRIDARARDWTLNCTIKLKGTTDRSIGWQGDYAHKSQWHRHLPFEYENLKDMFISKVDVASSDGEISDFSYTAETIVPILEASGIDVKDIFGLPFVNAKMRAATPAFRALMACPECGSKNFNGTKCINGHDIKLKKKDIDAIANLARMVGDPNITREDIYKKSAEIRGKAIANLEPISEDDVAKYMMPGGEEWILIKSPSVNHTRAVERSLKGVIALSDRDFPIRNFWHLAKAVSEHLTPQEAEALDDPLYEEVLDEVNVAAVPWA